MLAGGIRVRGEVHADREHRFLQLAVLVQGERHLADVTEKIAQLQALRTELARMSVECAGGRGSACKVIKVLHDHDLCAAGDHRPGRNADSPLTSRARRWTGEVLMRIQEDPPVPRRNRFTLVLSVRVRFQTSSQERQDRRCEGLGEVFGRQNVLRHRRFRQLTAPQP